MSEAPAGAAKEARSKAASVRVIGDIMRQTIPRCVKAAQPGRLFTRDLDVMVRARSQQGLAKGLSDIWIRVEPARPLRGPQSPSARHDHACFSGW
ncbi:MAG: hypothetical protein AMXMBFR64_34410 [Myxococcales bacterium]